MSLSKYIDRTGELVMPQPFLGQGTHFSGLILQMNPDTVQTRICDKYLNNPAGWNKRFVPAIPFATLAFCSIDRLTCTLPPYDNWGWFPEQEVAIWLLLRDTVADIYCWFHPYMFVDNPLALLMGREIFGFAKEMGRITITEEAYKLDTLVLKKYLKSEEGQWSPLIDVICSGNEHSGIQELESLGRFVEELIKFVARNGGLHLLTDYRLMQSLKEGVMSSVFLKQFRDVANGTNACYQAITTCPATMTDFRNPKLIHHDFTVTFHEYASEPIVQDLGLTSNIVKPILGFSAEFNFCFENGSELWRA